MAGGNRGDEFNSQVIPAVVMEMTPGLEAKIEAESEIRIEQLRQRAREKDELVALEIRLLHNTVKRMERTLTRICEDNSAAFKVQTDTLEVLRKIHEAQSSTAVETPQLQSMAVETLREIKELVAAITMVATARTNGHGDTT